MQGTTPPPSPPLPPFPVQSAKRLNATSEWRLTVRPEAVVCKACAKSSRSHYMHVVGHCSQGRPIIYSCLVGGGGGGWEEGAHFTTDPHSFPLSGPRL